MAATSCHGEGFDVVCHSDPPFQGMNIMLKTLIIIAVLLTASTAQAGIYGTMADTVTA
jgi:hypothetical protein